MADGYDSRYNDRYYSDGNIVESNRYAARQQQPIVRRSSYDGGRPARVDYYDDENRHDNRRRRRRRRESSPSSSIEMRSRKERPARNERRRREHDSYRREPRSRTKRQRDDYYRHDDRRYDRRRDRDRYDRDGSKYRDDYRNDPPRTSHGVSFNVENSFSTQIDIQTVKEVQYSKARMKIGVIAVTLIFILGGLGTGIAALLGLPWWTLKAPETFVRLEVGLWKTCQRTSADGEWTCKKYTEEASPFSDMELLRSCMVAGVVLLGVSGFTVFSLFCTLKKRKVFKITIYISALLSLVAAILFGIVLAFVTDTKDSKELVPKWVQNFSGELNHAVMFYMACAATGCAFLALAQVFVLGFVSDDNGEETYLAENKNNRTENNNNNNMPDKYIKYNNNNLGNFEKVNKNNTPYRQMAPMSNGNLVANQGQQHEFHNNNRNHSMSPENGVANNRREEYTGYNMAPVNGNRPEEYLSYGMSNGAANKAGYLQPVQRTHNNNIEYHSNPMSMDLINQVNYRANQHSNPAYKPMDNLYHENRHTNGGVSAGAVNNGRLARQTVNQTVHTSSHYIADPTHSNRAQVINSRPPPPQAAKKTVLGPRNPPDYETNIASRPNNDNRMYEDYYSYFDSQY